MTSVLATHNFENMLFVSLPIGDYLDLRTNKYGQIQVNNQQYSGQIMT